MSDFYLKIEIKQIHPFIICGNFETRLNPKAQPSKYSFSLIGPRESLYESPKDFLLFKKTNDGNEILTTCSVELSEAEITQGKLSMQFSLDFPDYVKPSIAHLILVVFPHLVTTIRKCPYPLYTKGITDLKKLSLPDDQLAMLSQ